MAPYDSYAHFTPNRHIAVEWITKSARAGYAPAQHQLAVLFSQDTDKYIESYVWIETALQNGLNGRKKSQAEELKKQLVKRLNAKDKEKALELIEEYKRNHNSQ